MAFTHRTTGDDPQFTHTHETVAEARTCEDQAAQAAEECWAEGAWLRAAEAGTPDSWHEEDMARMAEACGYGPPPSF